MYNILVVGVGSIGERHVRCVLATGRAKVSVCEVSAELAKSVAGRYDVQQTFADFEALDLKQFDGVVICVPANLHVAMARKVVAAGVHLYCEKPLTVTEDGVKELLAEIERTDVVAGVGHTWRYIQPIRDMYERVAAGEIGELKEIVIRAGQFFPHFRPTYKQTYYTRPESGGGAILDGMSHLVNMAQMFCGEVAKVAGMYQNSGLLDVPVEDTVDALLAFRKGAWCNIHLSQWQRKNQGDIQLEGSAGAMRYRAEARTVDICREIEGQWESKTYTLERDDNYIAEADNFFNAIEGKEKVLCTVQEAYHTWQVCMGIRESFDKGKWVEIGGSC